MSGGFPPEHAFLFALWGFLQLLAIRPVIGMLLQHGEWILACYYGLRS